MNQEVVDMQWGGCQVCSGVDRDAVWVLSVQ
jgi:hypothetical protein